MEIMGLVKNVEKIRIGTWIFYLYSVGLAVASILQNLSKYRERERGNNGLSITLIPKVLQ